MISFRLRLRKLVPGARFFGSNHISLAMPCSESSLYQDIWESFLNVQLNADWHQPSYPHRIPEKTPSMHLVQVAPARWRETAFSQFNSAPICWVVVLRTYIYIWHSKKDTCHQVSTSFTVVPVVCASSAGTTGQFFRTSSGTLWALQMQRFNRFLMNSRTSIYLAI